MTVTDTDPLQALRLQIEDIYGRFKIICAETAALAADPRMPDAAQQLNGVLAETEQAATTILLAGRGISELVGAPGIPEAVRAGVQAEITRIYEASSFQDISGQRIKKVLHSLQQLEQQLDNLFRAARGEAAVPAAAAFEPANPLLNGPALGREAPSQAEIDALFS